MITLDNQMKMLGLDLIDVTDFVQLVTRFSLNMLVVLALVRWLYYSVSRRKDYLFTYMLIAMIIFLLCYLLESVKLELGFALGLFAIFGIIRYRTSAMPIKEMTYLFVVIGISVINALANKKISIAELLFTNLVVVAVVYGYEKVWLLKHESVKTIVYDKINLIRPELYNDLLEDLRQRTGIAQINRVEVGQIDLLKDTCRINIYYEEPGQQINLADQPLQDDDNDDD